MRNWTQIQGAFQHEYEDETVLPFPCRAARRMHRCIIFVLPSESVSHNTSKYMFQFDSNRTSPTVIPFDKKTLNPPSLLEGSSLLSIQVYSSKYVMVRRAVPWWIACNTRQHIPYGGFAINSRLWYLHNGESRESKRRVMRLNEDLDEIVFYKKLKNVSCEYDRVNGWNSTLQAAWYIRRVRIICFLWTKPTIWLLILSFTQNIVRACSMFYPYEGYRWVTPLDAARVDS